MFYSDFKLTIRNCFTFTPPVTPVDDTGQVIAVAFEGEVGRPHPA